MICGLADMPFPITVISATGKGCAISASSSVAKPPVINVPSLERLPCAWLMTRTLMFLGLYFKALLWMNLAPESASPTNVFTSISLSR